MDCREVNHKWYREFNESSMEFIVDMEIDGKPYSEEEVSIPACYAVCSVCNGKGSHVNPSIDSNGLSQEDFDEDPDFRENYFSGMYDVQCYTCNGKRVEPVVDWEAFSNDKELTKKVQDFIDEWYNYQAEIARERKYGY